MRKNKSIIFIVIILMFSCVSYAQNLNTLKVVIKNIEQLQGSLRLQLCDDSTSFLSDKPQMEWVREAKVDKAEMVFTYSSLPDGEYAIVVFQDMNENGVLDSGKFGIPKEPFAFSNAAMRRFGPPYFSQAKFLISGGGKHTHELVLIYRRPKKKK